MAMDHAYEVRATAPGETLSMHIESRRGGELAFDATLNLQRRPLTAAARCALLGASLRTLALIYAHGVALKLKGVALPPAPGGLVMIERVARGSLSHCSNASQSGQLDLVEGGRRRVFGSGSPKRPSSCTTRPCGRARCAADGARRDATSTVSGTRPTWPR